MKSEIRHRLCAAIICCSSAAHATTVIVGDQLRVGSNNTGWSAPSGVIGTYNTINSPDSFALGRFNYINQDDNDFAALAVGYQNTMDGAYSSIVTGAYNFASSSSSLTVGYYNHNDANASLIVGLNHIASHLYHQRAIITGRNSATPSKAAYFVVGNGASTAARENAFVVYADGDIVITKPQGDISMGIYE